MLTVEVTSLTIKCKKQGLKRQCLRDWLVKRVVMLQCSFALRVEFVPKSSLTTFKFQAHALLSQLPNRASVSRILEFDRLEETAGGHIVYSLIELTRVAYFARP